MSHVPHLLAFAFADALAAAPPGAGELAGGGFRDFTRIAQSDPELWADILVANRKAIAGPLQQVVPSAGRSSRARSWRPAIARGARSPSRLSTRRRPRAASIRGWR